MVARAGASKLGCLFYLMFVAAVVYVSIPLGEAYFRYAEYKDAMKQELRFRANLSNDKIRSHLQDLVATLVGQSVSKLDGPDAARLRDAKSKFDRIEKLLASAPVEIAIEFVAIFFLSFAR